MPSTQGTRLSSPRSPSGSFMRVTSTFKLALTSFCTLVLTNSDDRCPRRSLRRQQPAKSLFITLKCKSAPEDRIVDGLADVLVDGPTLASAIDLHDVVEFGVGTTDEPRAKLKVQGVRDALGQRPGEHRKSEFARHRDGRLTRPAVIRVPGYTALVKDEQEIGPRPLHGPMDSRVQLGNRLVGELSVAIVEQLHLSNAEFVRSGGEFTGSDASEFGGVGPESRRLTMREAQHRGRGSRFVERRECRAQSEAPVVGVRAHREHRTGCG